MVVPKRISAVAKPIEEEGEVLVNKTTNEQYVRKASEDEKATSKVSAGNPLSEDNEETNNGAFQTERITREIPRNRLAELFESLQEDFDEDEQFYFMVRRMPDMFNDNFRVPCSSSIDFPPLPFFSNQMLNLYPMLQKANGNSGGRFQIVVLDSGTSDTGYGIKALVIPNPLIEEKPLVDGNGNPDMQAVMAMFAKEREETRSMFLQMLNQKNQQPQEDDFVKALKEKMMHDLLNPPQQRDKIAEMMEAPVVMATFMGAMGEAFKKMLESTNGGGSDRAKGTLELVLENEPLMNKVGETVGKVVDAAGIIIANGRQPQPPQGVPYYPQPQPNTTYPPLGVGVNAEQSQEPEKYTREEIEAMELVESIFAELEGDNILDDNNELIQELKEAYPEQFEQTRNTCRQAPLDTMLMMLVPMLPKGLDVDLGEYFIDGQVSNRTEKGNKIYERLQELHQYMKEEKPAESVSSVQ